MNGRRGAHELHELPRIIFIIGVGAGSKPAQNTGLKSRNSNENEREHK